MMRRRRMAIGIVAILLVLGLWLGLGRWGEVASHPAPPFRQTLERVGKRLALSHSAAELGELARDQNRLVGTLKSGERSDLGRGLVRFNVSNPVIVDLAVPERSIPFWLADRGFQRSGQRLENEDGGFLLYEGRFESGWVELGVNCLDWSAGAHYAIFVRPQKRGGPLDIIAAEPDRWTLSKAVEGASPYRDARRPFKKLPVELLGSTIVRTRHDERHAAILFHGRVWKTHVVSSHRPDQIVITPTADAGRGLSWTWRTAPESLGTVLRIARSGNGSPGPSSCRIVQGSSWLVETLSVANDPAIRRHHVVVDDLEPGSAYFYSVGDGGPDGWSEWLPVRTGPDRSADFRFLYLGDAQTGLERWGQLLAEAYRRNPDVGFVSIAGDLVDRGNERTNWDHFFLRAKPVFDRLAMVPCVGNHEYLDEGPRLFRSFFRPPGNGPAGFDAYLNYAFEYGDALFVTLDSTQGLTDPGRAVRQAEWLDGVLADSKAGWKFVMFHHPVHASHVDRESTGLAAAWIPVFDRHRVDLVLQGHDHAYLRTYPIRYGHVNRWPATNVIQGTVYVVSVSGDKFYDQNPRGVAATGLTQVSTYQVIDLQPRSGLLTYRAFDFSGKVVDEFRIKKNEQRANHSLVEHARE